MRRRPDPVSGQPTVLFCVGATKAGTSWLYRYLSGHPDCHLRSIKELHYFDAIETGTLRSQKVRMEGDLLRARARQAESGSGPLIDAVIKDMADWIAVLGQGHRAIGAYLGYLANGAGAKRLVADITPSYALLPEGRLRMMAGIVPDVRFLYLLRDPVARLWSGARMVGRRQALEPDQVPARSIEAMEQMISGIEAGGADREDYAGAITRLQGAVPPQRLMIQLMDDLFTVSGLARLCRFLGIANFPGDFDTRHHEGPTLALPDDLRLRAQRALRPQYDFVARLFPDLPDSWRRNMTEVHG
jgi:hypothetical protein